MKIFKVLAVLGVLAGVGPAAMAQSTSLRIAVVNVQQLIEESPQAKAVQATLQNEFGPKMRDIETQQKELKAREEKLQRDAAVMAEAERSKAERELREGVRDLTRKQNEVQEDINVRRNEEFGRLQKVLLQEIQVYAKTQGYDLVVSEGVLFAKPDLNITSAVLAALQAKNGGKPAAAAAPAPKAPAAPAPAKKP